MLSGETECEVEPMLKPPCPVRFSHFTSWKCWGCVRRQGRGLGVETIVRVQEVALLPCIKRQGCGSEILSPVCPQRAQLWECAQSSRPSRISV